MVQDVDADAICVGFLEVSAYDFDFEGEVDVGAVFEGDLHDALAGDLDDLHSCGPVLQLLQTDYLRDFSLALDGDDQGGQFVYLKLHHAVDVSGDLQFGYTGSDEDSHRLAVLDGQFHLSDFLAVFYSLDGEDLLQVKFLTIREGVHFGLDLDHMKLAALSLIEVVHEFCEEGELLEGGGEDGVLAEVYLVLVDLEALARLEQREGAAVAALLLRLVLHWPIITRCSNQIESSREERYCYQGKVECAAISLDKSFKCCDFDPLQSMIYQPPVKYQLTQQEEEIYRRILDRHRRYISEKSNLTRRYNSHIFQHKHRPKSRFYDESRTKTFANTLLNKAKTEGPKLTLAEMEQIPAQEFLELCEQLEKMSIRKKKDKDTSQSKSVRSTSRKNKSIAQKIHDTPQQPRRYDSLQKNMKKLLPKLPKGGIISNRDFFDLFMKKAKEAQKISCIKEQIELQIEYENHCKVEEIMNARKTVKEYMLNLALVSNFRNGIENCLELGKRLCETIGNQSAKLKSEAYQPSKEGDKAQKNESFSIQNIKISMKSKQQRVFQRINDKITQFNDRTQQYFEGELLQSIPIRELQFFVQYLTTSIRELFMEINLILAEISHQLSGEQLKEKKQCVLPKEVSTITNPYAFTNFRQIYEQFMSGRQFLQSFYEYLNKIIHLKDMNAVCSEKKSSSNNPRRRKTGSGSVRII